MEHDLTTKEGVFGYFAEKTNIFSPIIEDSIEKDAKIEEIESSKRTLIEVVADLDFRLMMGGL